MYSHFQIKDLNKIPLSVEMRKLKSFYSIWILHVALHLAMVHAQEDQSGFISIDCGIPEGSKYMDKRTGINYVSDAGFIESGVNQEISPAYNLESLDVELTTLRSFPQNIRNCYTLSPKQGKNNTYLIRVRYLYGNYDSKGQPPQFSLYLGADLWSGGSIPNPSGIYYDEIIHLATSDFINICLLNSGQGIPFGSAIELRLLDNAMYETQSTSLYVTLRYSFGSKEQVRYGDDKYDRIWYPFTGQGYSVVKSSTSNTISSGPQKVPSKVMSTALTPTISTDAIFIPWDATITDKYIMYLHFAELETLTINQTREFNIYINGDYAYGPFSPSTKITTLNTLSPLTGFSNYTLKINRTLNSTLPPIINAIEVYRLKQFQQQHTFDQDAAAIWSTKSTYGIKRNWQGDPCVPQAYVWDGLNCSYRDLEAVRIISLNLSSSGLSGEIAPALANLSMTESLDLSYNNLTGNVPEFLGRQENLRLLNLLGNNFTKPLPQQLQEKAKKGLLTLRIEVEFTGENTSSCPHSSCRNNKHTRIIIAATITPVVILLTAFAIIWMIKRRKRKELIINDELLTPKHQQLTFSEVRSITNNFKTVIGRGGFGTVYHGHIGDNQVAVKMLSTSSAQGYKEFQVEVKLLLDVRHKNITSLVAYCNDNNHKGIIYEFMANGNLEKHLFDGSPNVLSWERRLRIGRDAAEGLAYMHHGCRPSIVHRDVKPSNILLNESFHAKLADFGLSRAFIEDVTHVSTVVAGTRGYLDPEYYSTNRLTEKSDVYSFGVVLLELITGRRAISEGINIIEWVKSMLAEGSIQKIIDPRLEGFFNNNTAWKVVELAIGCVSYTSMKRPTMNDVVIELNNCLQAERTHHVKPYNQGGYVSYNIETASTLNPR